MKRFTYAEIKTDELTAIDLRGEASNGGTAYKITIYEDNQPLAEQAQALYSGGRLGIAWGADATWADVSSVEWGIEVWLNDCDVWEAHH